MLLSVPWFQALGGKKALGGKNSKGEDIIMVDPSEAKRLAAEQMQKIQDRKKRIVSESFIYLKLRGFKDWSILMNKIEVIQ